MEVSERGRRWLRQLVVSATGLVVLSGVAAAHGTPGQAGESVAFAVVVGLPIVAGLAGGAVTVGHRRRGWTDPHSRRAGVALGALLVVLGATIVASAFSTGRWLGVVGATLGAIAVLLTTRGDGAPRHRCHADLTLAAVSAHRLLEGLAIGALYSAGAAVGLIGAVFLAGHTALETAAVGGVYATSHGRIRAVGAVLLVQTGYAAGAVVGLGVAGALPASARALAIAVAGGALLIVGAGEAERSIAARRPATA